MDIPNVPGVPPLPSYSSQIFGLLTTDIIGIVGGLFLSQWGVFLNGIPVLAAADNFVTLDFKQDFAISDYPVEGNSLPSLFGGSIQLPSFGGSSGFQSYNKVALPADIRVRVSCGGSESKRETFIASLHALVPNTFLYDIVTPERAYLNYNFSHIDYRRSATSGAGLITVDLWFTEIRTSLSATFVNTAAPAIAATAALGAVQPLAPSDALTGAAGGGFF